MILASVRIVANPNNQYAFWTWRSTSSSVTITNESATSTSVTVNGPATVTAVFAKIFGLAGQLGSARREYLKGFIDGELRGDVASLFNLDPPNHGGYD